MILFETGFGVDDFTRFCLANTEDEAKAKFIETTKEVLDRNEEPGWEEQVWAQDVSERWMGLISRPTLPPKAMKKSIEFTNQEASLVDEALDFWAISSNRKDHNQIIDMLDRIKEKSEDIIKCEYCGKTICVWCYAANVDSRLCNPGKEKMKRFIWFTYGNSLLEIITTKSVIVHAKDLMDAKELVIKDMDPDDDPDLAKAIVNEYGSIWFLQEINDEELI